MSGVMLGLPGQWANDNFEPCDYYTTKIGGLPDWPIPETYMIHDLLECGMCGKRLCLVAQVHAPITRDSSKVEERIIYILGCVAPNCGSQSSSWHVLRAQKSSGAMKSTVSIQEIAPSVATPDSVSRSNWWEEDLFRNDDDGSDGDLDLQELGRALSEAASLASNSNKQNDHRHHPQVLPTKDSTNVGKDPTNAGKDSTIPVIPCFYIYPEEELSSNDVSVNSASFSAFSIEEDKSLIDDHGEEKYDPERYEYDRALDVDRIYLKFKKRVDVYPEQCFRYSYGGKPLLAAMSEEEPDNCHLCGGSRHFEMQLMPPLLYFLQENSDDPSTCSLEGWNWMTILVYTCSKSCFQPSDEGHLGINGWTIVEEAIIIQNEDLLQESSRLAFFK